MYAEEDIAWVHFRAPDGNIYELTQGSDLKRHRPHKCTLSIEHRVAFDRCRLRI